jgi:hypothetical protein
MSLEGNACFLIVYHYKLNAILALPIANSTNKTILVAYQQQFEVLESRGHNICLNVMDNQASKVMESISRITNAITSLSNPTTIELIRLNAPYRRSRHTSSVRSPQPAASFPSNYGIV